MSYNRVKRLVIEFHDTMIDGITAKKL